MQQRLYIMENEQGLVKIGVSKNPQQRRGQLKNASGFEVTLVGHTKVEVPARDIEQALHVRWAEFRKCGEWFDLPHELKVTVTSKIFLLRMYAFSYLCKYGVTTPEALKVGFFEDYHLSEFLLLSVWLLHEYEGLQRRDCLTFPRADTLYNLWEQVDRLRELFTEHSDISMYWDLERLLTITLRR